MSTPTSIKAVRIAPADQARLRDLAKRSGLSEAAVLRACIRVGADELSQDFGRILAGALPAGQRDEPEPEAA